MVTYFSDINTINAQKVSETMPRIWVGPGAWPVAVSAVENV